MATLFELESSVQERQDAAARAKANASNPRMTQDVINDLRSQMRANNSYNRLKSFDNIAAGIDKSGLLGDYVTLNPERKRASDINSIKEKVTSQHKFGTPAFFKAAATELAAAGYAQEALSAIDKGLTFGQKQATIEETKANTQSKNVLSKQTASTLIDPVLKQENDRKLLETAVKDGKDVSGFTTTSFQTTKDLEEAIRARGELSVKGQTTTFIPETGQYISIDSKGITTVSSAKGYTGTGGDPKSKLGKLAEDMGFKVGSTEYHNKVEDLNNQLNEATQGGSAFMNQLAVNDADFLSENSIKATSTVSKLNNNDAANILLDQGIFTGLTANIKLKYFRSAKALDDAFNTNTITQEQRDLVVRTQEFSINRAKETIALLGSGDLGTGNAISDKDKEFMEKVAGGQITLDERTLRKIVEINTIVSIEYLKRYNAKIEEINKSRNLTGTNFEQKPVYFNGQIRRHRDDSSLDLVYDNGNWVLIKENSNE